MSKKKPVIETHGKVEEAQPTMLEQVWGYNELSRYGTKNEGEYRTKLNDMNRADLEAHARKMGVVVVESSDRLREKLLNEFRVFYSSLHRPPQLVQKPLSKELRDEAMKILSEGK